MCTPPNRQEYRRDERIFLSNSIVSPKAQRGVSRYFQKISEGLVKEFGAGVLLCSPHQETEFSGRHIRTPQFAGSHWLKAHDIVASLIARKERPDIFYSAYYGNTQSNSPQIFTVYDMIHERFPQYFSPQSAAVRSFIAEKRRCFERASLLIAISAATAKDILALYPYLDPAKLEVVPLGVEDRFFESVERPFNAERPYLLYVGHRNYHKNFARTLCAFGESGLVADADLRVISPSGSTFTEDEQAIIQRYTMGESVFLMVGASEELLHASYANAKALIYPSEYEGFGLPILEGMASGTLVATSNVSSMPEVAGTSAEYFDPYSVESIAEALQRIFSLSDDERTSRISSGIKHARTFSWERCQTTTNALFHRLLAAKK